MPVRPESALVCTVAGCSTRSRNISGGLCEKHYYRMRRTGTLERPANEPRLCASGYVRYWLPEHPLAMKSGYVYVHRLNYYENNGEGPFDCFHCGIEVNWKTLEVDHLDFNKANNGDDNLVASCKRCNLARAKPRMIATAQAKAARIEFDGERLTAREWSDRLGIGAHVIRRRQKKGWPIEKVLSSRNFKRGPRSVLFDARVKDRAGQIAFELECTTGRKVAR